MSAAGHCSDDLRVIPSNIGIHYFRKKLTFEGKVKGKRHKRFFKSGYLHDITLGKNKYSPIVTVPVSAKCWRSMCQCQNSHSVDIDIRTSNEILDEAYCSCTAGYVPKLTFIFFYADSRLAQISLHPSIHIYIHTLTSPL